MSRTRSTSTPAEDGGPRPPAPAQDTPRARLRALLLEGPATARQLSERAGLSEKDVRHHLQHLLRSAQSRGDRLSVDPARCEACGFVFRDRDRLGKPGRCPACQSSRISPPRFGYQTGG